MTSKTLTSWFHFLWTLKDGILAFWKSQDALKTSGMDEADEKK